MANGGIGDASTTRPWRPRSTGDPPGAGTLHPDSSLPQVALAIPALGSSGEPRVSPSEGVCRRWGYPAPETSSVGWPAACHPKYPPSTWATSV